MLIEKTIYEEGAVLVMKLVSGDEIVAKVLKYDPSRETIKVKQPLQVHIVRTPEGMAKQLMPLLMLAPESDPIIELHSVVAVVPAPREVEDTYTTETSGIILAR